MKVRLSSQARQDLIAIGDYIARDNPSRAASFVAELANKCANLTLMPLGSPIVARYQARGIRRRVHGNDQIFYGVDRDQLHGARDYEALL